MKRRLVVRNPEVMQKLYSEGKSVVFMSAHFNNWEPLITAINVLFPHQAFGIGTPLSNKFWDKKINERRERFGMIVTTAENYKQKLAEYKDKPSSVLVLGDQSPGKGASVYWTDFLNRKTAFYFGAEVLANEMNMAVVYGSIYKVKRGYYELELKLITDQPRSEPYGSVTEGYVRLLEKDIQALPEYWLWSHKRWKTPVPENLTEIQAAHKEKFEKRFRA
jgi:KDO2-lipid IV(A) lauroyltransferase